MHSLFAKAPRNCLACTREDLLLGTSALVRLSNGCVGPANECAAAKKNLGAFTYILGTLTKVQYLVCIGRTEVEVE